MKLIDIPTAIEIPGVGTWNLKRGGGGQLLYVADPRRTRIYVDRRGVARVIPEVCGAAQSLIALIASSSGGAQANNVTLPSFSGLITYITGFDVTGGGATSAADIAVTLTGTNSTNTPTWFVAIPAGATSNVLPITFPRFAPAMPAVDINTSLVVNVPSFGAGNTNAACNAYGYAA